ncbi:sodium channel protein type 4 subunit alpha-like [Denticeps clupeoides]|uniref:Sodium channel protein n=1 Tax=Denticeps clupeoides TaxID=299321 RepID=A0AAY4E0A5_9TELE|nr:sodium channel protein type 4 subunit alpha-like [Denticeps clupeoides]
MPARRISILEAWDRNSSIKRKAEKELRLGARHMSLLRNPDAVKNFARKNAEGSGLLLSADGDVFRRYASELPSDPESKNESKESKEKDCEKATNLRADETLRMPNSDLEEGKVLPLIYGAPPLELIHQPLEELDPFYKAQNTFIALNKNNNIFRFSAGRACFILGPLNIVRRGAINVLTHSFFSVFMLLALLIALLIPLTPLAQFGMSLYLLTGACIIEVAVKVTARGICLEKFTYLRDPWNWIDLLVLCLLCFFLIFNIDVDLPTFIKFFCLLPGLRTTFTTVIQSVKKAAGVILFTVFCISVFAICGQVLFMGRLKQRCVKKPVTDINSSIDIDIYKNKQENQYFLPGDEAPLLCSTNSDFGTCPEGFMCMKVDHNPDHGFTSYDSFGWALLSLLRLMTLDYWENLLDLTLRTAGPTSVLFFVVMIVLTSLYLMSLLLSVVAMTCVEQNEVKIAEDKKKEKHISMIKEHFKKLESKSKPSDSTDKEQGGKNGTVNGENDDTEEPEPSRRGCCHKCAGAFCKWNCCAPWITFKKAVRSVMLHPFMDLFIATCIVINFIFLAMDFYPMSPEFEIVLAVGNLVFTAIYTLEMILKIIAMDPYYYFKDGMNIFDSFIVFVGLLELVLADVQGLSVLRVFRVMRVFRLTRFSATLQLFMNIISHSACYISLALFIFVFASSMLGFLLFSVLRSSKCEKTQNDCERPIWHMEDFIHTFMLIFRMLYCEWIETLWDCMEIVGPGTCLSFYTIVLLIGKLLIVILFLTLLLKSFSAPSRAGLQKTSNNLSVAFSRIYRGITRLCRATNEEDEESKEKIKGPSTKDSANFSRIDTNPLVKEVKEKHRSDSITPEDCCPDMCNQCFRCHKLNISQGSGKVWWTFRCTCYTIVEHNCFQIFMIVIILLSSSALVLEDMFLEERKVRKMAVEYADYIFTFVFLIELLLKLAAHGFKVYLTSAWCCLDLFILDVSVICLIADLLGYSTLGPMLSFRTLRALIPLRILSRLEGLRVVANTLVGMIPSLFSFFVVCQIFWFCFIITGVNLFAGKFFFCYNTTSHTTLNEVNNRTECYELMELNFSVSWESPKITYDNVFIGYLAMLQVLTAKGWIGILRSAIDSRMIDDQPKFEDNIYMFLYFVTTIVFCSFLTFSLFIGVILDHFNKQKAKLGGKNIFMTENQMRCYRNIMNMGYKKPIPRPSGKCASFCVDLVTKQSFEIFIMTVIGLSAVALMLDKDDLSPEMETILYFLHLSIIAVFTTECVLKLIAFRKYYFCYVSNIYDFITVLVSVIGMFLADYIGVEIPCLLRLFRIFRVLQYIQKFKSIWTPLSALTKSIPSIFNIGLFFFVIMFVYSIFGMFQFPFLKEESLVNDLFNFKTFGNSIMTMFTIATWAGWDGLLNPMLNSGPPECHPDLEHPGFNIRGNCGSPALGIVFVCSYIVISFLLVVLMFIAIILEYFSVTVEESVESQSENEFNMFMETWKEFDPDATQFIDYSKLSDLCDALKEPLRVPKPNAVKLVTMDLPMAPGEKIHCLDILLALAAEAHGKCDEIGQIKATMQEKFIASSCSKVPYDPVTTTMKHKQEDVAARAIQRAWHKCMQKQSIYQVSDTDKADFSCEDDLLPDDQDLNVIQLSKLSHGEARSKDRAAVVDISYIED